MGSQWTGKREWDYDGQGRVVAHREHQYEYDELFFFERADYSCTPSGTLIQIHDDDGPIPVSVYEKFYKDGVLVCLKQQQSWGDRTTTILRDSRGNLGSALNAMTARVLAL